MFLKNIVVTKNQNIIVESPNIMKNKRKVAVQNILRLEDRKDRLCLTIKFDFTPQLEYILAIKI